MLDEQGRGVISDVIAAFEWAVANRVAHNIRVINLSVGARVTESYKTDPLTLAAKRAVDAGIVVVTAAGNLGKKANGKAQYGSITAPGNAPWVLTVGASSTEGTVDRAGTTRWRLQLARSDGGRLRGEAGPRRARAPGMVSLERSDERVLQDEGRVPAQGHAADGLQAVSEPERHQHGVAGRGRHRRPDDAGEPEADAEPGEGDPSVHGADATTTTR